MSYKLGLTGSIGMGKSTTAQMFREFGIPVWDADACVHELYEKGGGAVEPIQKQFPSVIREGAVSRDRLKALIAKDDTALHRIEQIVHPLVAQDRAAFISAHPDELLVFDVPLLFETQADDWLDGVLVVTAPESVQRARVMARGTMTEAQFLQILGRQLPDAEKRKRADFLIETRTIEQTREEIKALIQQLQETASDA